ncbi:hypothetical protein B0H16DRAFT_1860578 [Mycena metata]|uniref:Uncharacterized protein n=1 Tax=Mycena metata TaxID=1033252 RepID=A0AAD7IIR6_9AGAR|nr:hypothetical protein B0H16DRAFT_1860560 [Mycena metata]KAJ7742821.1 hypothetical protein B0H16DRAFT_1860578 [Mycena metata]
MERPYITKEVEGLGQKELVALVRRQINKWPLTPGKLSKANKADLKSKLLDPKYGFTTDKPAIPGTDSVPGGSTAGPSATIATAPTVDNLGPVEPSPTPENGGTVLVPREIRLLIDDRRASYPIHTMQRVQVRFVDTADCGENEWRADASEILLALQKSISSITGSAKIGTPDRLNSSYTEYFVEIISNQPVETLAVSPELVVISEDNQLTLRVDTIQRLEVDAQPTHTNPSGVLPPGAPVVATASGALNAQDRARPRTRELTQQEIEWLKKQLSTRQGYTQFDASHNKVLQNVERVRYWRFAAEFSRVFHKQTWPQEISSPSKGISKGAIEKALSMSKSALLDTIQMIEIIDRYTVEGSDNYSEEVTNEITKSNENMPKAATLKAFLTGWDRAHRATFTTI